MIFSKISILKFIWALAFMSLMACSNNRFESGECTSGDCLTKSEAGDDNNTSKRIPADDSNNVEEDQTVTDDVITDEDDHEDDDEEQDEDESEDGEDESEEDDDVVISVPQCEKNIQAMAMSHFPGISASDYPGEKQISVINLDNFDVQKSDDLLQDAINMAENNSMILVGKGAWPEKVKVLDRDHLYFYGNCEANVNQFKLISSYEIKINGFILDPGSFSKNFDGISLQGRNENRPDADEFNTSDLSPIGKYKNHEIEISNNDISGYGLNDNGIRVAGRNHYILIESNYIHHSKRHGINLSGGHEGTKVTVRNNLITTNSNRGIYIGGQWNEVLLQENIVYNNGRFGVSRGDAGQSKLYPEDVTLLGNIIAENGTRFRQIYQGPNATLNLDNISGLLDLTDFNNVYLMPPGVLALIPPQ